MKVGISAAQRKSMGAIHKRIDEMENFFFTDVLLCNRDAVPKQFKTGVIMKTGTEAKKLKSMSAIRYRIDGIRIHIFTDVLIYCRDAVLSRSGFEQLMQTRKSMFQR